MINFKKEENVYKSFPYIASAFQNFHFLCLLLDGNHNRLIYETWCPILTWAILDKFIVELAVLLECKAYFSIYPVYLVQKCQFVHFSQLCCWTLAQGD